MTTHSHVKRMAAIVRNRALSTEKREQEALELDAIDLALETVRIELIRATKLHGPMRSAHEAYGIIAEEFDELFDEVKRNNKKRAQAEAVQVAAMAMRFMIDVS